ncbi:MAG: hypothetical protein A2057_09600 [Ignavibacteria bacterium GWA2_35_9]|nr:MAG: hypothetical protein A2057_09600 [Ignavibacteria bacterium GWA2_35_9]OGU43966.1 MAG: hypothetical protein A2000_00945 [Ignavibacteria bacterium GWB2_36_8]OGU53791.1 MAG: hypothetical protein A2080_06025 [Ignavibacteria bacterium GWC2_36_12]
MLRKIEEYFYNTIDILLYPFTILMAILFKYFRKHSLKNFPFTKRILLKVGVFPILDHYYEPLFNHKHLRYSLRLNRSLPGIDFNDNEQLEILEKFNYNNELLEFPIEKKHDAIEYCYNTGAFLSGDAEYLYNMIRLFKPKRIIEIGSGSSTLMAKNSIEKNKNENSDYICEQICIEPYEQPWLEQMRVQVIRKNVETIELNFFSSLEKNDILFIDSSHIIRPQGDVLFEYLEILPSLNEGVIVHIHDIFTPKDYLDEWFSENFWNEQYLLEAFLSFNKSFRIIGATNYLSHKFNKQFSEKCPIYKMQTGREPGSFWIIKN